MKLLIVVTTRGRPELLGRAVECTMRNMVHPDTRIMICADDDDAPTRNLLSKVANEERIIISVAPREDAIGQKANRAMAIPADIYANQSDYTAFNTPGFDERIIETASLFPDGIGVVVNPLRNASFSDMYAMTRKMADIVGFYGVGYFPYWFWDHWIDDLARLIGRMAMADIRIDYDLAGKPPTQGLREPDWWGTFFDAAYLLRRQQAFGLIDALDEPEWRKTILRQSTHLVEVRSKWVNSNLRTKKHEMEIIVRPPPPDERYKRIRAAAVKQIPHFLNDFGMGADEANEYRNALLPSSTVINLPTARRHAL